MVTAAIAFAGIEQARPDLTDKIGLLLMKHPDPAAFWVAAAEATAKERARRMFIEASRWPDGARWTIHDRPAWHSARWAIAADDAPPEAAAIVEARGGRPTGQALEALALNAAVLANPEAKPDERALALSWLMHVLGDIHQPFHVSDLFSKQFPSGNLAGSSGSVADPLAVSSLQLHLLWDNNVMRSTALNDVDEFARDITMRHFQTPAAGLAAVWATDNTREALWDALSRKEVYATTGTRMRVRVFAGWDFEASEARRPDFARAGYLRGVPIGGDLSSAPEGKVPAFMIRALRDVDGANLDRVQIVKGWLDSKGELRERVYDVLCSDERAITDEYRCDKPLGNTVDIEAATYTNSIGDALMMAFWQDPDFDPQQCAFYYVRVLEIPAPRWTTYDAAFFGVGLPEGVPPTEQ